MIHRTNTSKASLRGCLLLGLCAALASSACSKSKNEDPAKLGFTTDVVISSDPGHGVAGAKLSIGAREVATTDAEGRARVSLQGAEGDNVAISVMCPAGFQSPVEPITVSLRRLSPGSRAPSFASRCPPLTRTVVVGVRADNGPNLPVLYLGREVGRTDASGAAHVVLTVKAHEQITLALDTTAAVGKRAKLRPESPTLTFIAKDKDDFVTLEQKFELERPPVRTRSAPRKTGPTPI